MAKSVDHFKHELDGSLKKDKAVDQATREAALRQVDELKESAEKLESVLDDDRPASGEAKAVLNLAAKVQPTGSGHTLSPSARTAWGTVQRNLDKGRTGVRTLYEAVVNPHPPPRKRVRWVGCARHGRRSCHWSGVAMRQTCMTA